MGLVLNKKGVHYAFAFLMGWPDFDVALGKIAPQRMVVEGV
jgi:hypothetical protein